MEKAESCRPVVGTAGCGDRIAEGAGSRRRHLASQLWKSTALSTLALALSGVAAQAGQDGLWQPQVRAIIGADNNGAKSAIEGFLPLKQTLESVLFLDMRIKHDFDNGFGQDVGLGIRRIVNPDLMIGGYAYLDVQNSNSHQFVASTLGVEAITPNYDAHVNVYLPISGDVATSSFNSTLSLVGNQLLEQISSISRRDYAAWGVEGEVGIQAPVELPENHALRVNLGAYHFGDPDGDDSSVTGGKAGFEYAIGDVFGAGTSLIFAGEVREDNRDDTQFAGSVRLTIPLNAPDKGSAEDSSEPVYPVSEGLRKRVNERVRGDIGVRLEGHEKGASTTTRVAIDAATGSAFGSFFFADGGNTLGLGTSGDPTTLDDAVANAGSNGVIVALGGQGNLFTAGVTLADGQTIIGGGENVTVRLANGGARTFDFGGSNATISGTNPANGVITLANGNTLSGITVTGGANGIFGNNISGVTLTNVTVTGAVGNGAAFTGSSTGIKASDFTATGNGLDGLSIDSDGTFSFTGTTLLSGNGDDGLDIAGQGTYSFATLHAQDNLDAGIHVSGTSVSGSITTTGGTVSGNGGVAVFIDPITAHVTLDSVSHDGGVSGIVLEDIAGSFTVTGDTTVSNTSGAAIAISNSPAAVRFGNIEISNPGDDGISFAGVNAAVVAGDIVISGLGAGSTGLDFSNSKTNFTARSVDISGTGAGSIGIDLAQTIAGSSVVITNGGSIVNVGSGVRLGIAGPLAHSANAQLTFGGGSISGVTASLDARGLNQTLGSYAFGSTSLVGPQLFEAQNLIFVGATATGSGTGSSMADLATIATADANTDANAIFVLVNRGTAIDDADGFSLSAGQTLASFGSGRQFSLGGVPINVTGANVQQGITISDAGGAATLTSSGGGNTVRLAANSSLLDLNLTGTGNGVYGNGVSNVTLTGLTVSGAALHGLLFDGVNTVFASNLTVSSNGDTGISIQGGGNYAFSGVTEIAGNTGSGLVISGDGSYTIQTLNVTGNDGNGVVAAGTGAGELSITGGTISGNGAGAFWATGFGLDVNQASLDQTGGTTGIWLVGVSGDFAVSGATTISNSGASGIAISGSSATFGFDGPVAIANSLGNGITLDGNSGAVRFGEVAISQPGGNGIDITDNAGAVTFGATTVTMGGAANAAGIAFNGTNAAVTFGTTTVDHVGADQTGIDFSTSATTADFGVTTITGRGSLSSRGIDLSATSGNKVITFAQGSRITNIGVGVELSSGGTTATSANATFTFGDGASIDGLQSVIAAAAGGFTVNTVGLDPSRGAYDFDDVSFTGNANFGAGGNLVKFVSQAGGFISAGTVGNLSTGVNTISLADADALTGIQTFAFVGTINLGSSAFTLDSGQSIVSFSNGNIVSTGTPQPANVSGNLGGPVGNVSGEAAVVTGTSNFVTLLGDNAIRNTIFNFAGATGAAFLIDQGVGGFANGGGITIEGVTINNVAAGQAAIKVVNLDTHLSVVNNTISVAGKLLDISGGAGTISVSRGSAGTLTGGGIDIAGRTGGAVTFTDQVTVNGGGVSISGGGAGAAVNFNGGLDITTSTATGLSLTGLNALTIASAGSTTIQATGQTALSLQGTIGVGGIAFDSVTSTNSAGRGVLISGASGGAVDLDAVSVTASAGAGVEILNSTGVYIFGNTAIDNSTTGGRGLNVENIANTTSATFDGTLAIATSSGTGFRVIGNAPANTIVNVIGNGARSVSTANGTAVDMASVTVNASFSSTSAAFAGGNGVNLQNLTGLVSLGSGTLTNTGSGASFNVGSATDRSGGNATISYAGNIVSNGTGAAVSIQELTGGSATLSGDLTDGLASGGGQIVVANINNGTAASVTFSGTGKQIVTGANNAVSLTGNSNATIGFTNGGLGITTTTGPGFNATGGGTVTVQGGSNTITSGAATALAVVNTTIGSSNLTFRSISSNGAVNGIVLNNTGTIGGLTVTGDGGGSSNGSGGTIQNSTGTGVLLNATRSLNLAYMNIANSGGDGIGGTSVTNFTLDRSTLSNNGTAYGDAGIDFGGLFGTAKVTNSTIATSFEDNMRVRNSDGMLALTVRESTFSNASVKDQSNDGLLVDASGTATISAAITGNIFAANKGDHFQAVASNSGNLNIVFTQNTLAGGHAQALGQGITLAAATGVAFGGYTGTVNYDITDNTFNGAISSAINVNLGSSGSSALFNGFIRNNRIGTVGVAQSGSAQGSGIQLETHGNGTHTALVTGNTVVEAGFRAMSVTANDGNGVLNLTVQGNHLSASGSFAQEAFFLNNGSTSTNIFGVPDSHTVRLDLGGAGPLQNTFARGASAADDFRIRQRFNSTIILEGYTGAATDTAAVVSYVQSRNTGSNGVPGSATVQAPGAGFLPGTVPLPDPF